MMKASAHDKLLQTLQTRFAEHPNRHVGIKWPDVLARIGVNAAALAMGVDLLTEAQYRKL